MQNARYNMRSLGHVTAQEQRARWPDCVEIYMGEGKHTDTDTDTDTDARARAHARTCTRTRLGMGHVQPHQGDAVHNHAAWDIPLRSDTMTQWMLSRTASCAVPRTCHMAGRRRWAHPLPCADEWCRPLQ